MSHITTEHRGYEITYNEVSETWGCSTLGLGAEKLKTLKAKIDKVMAEARKAGTRLKALIIDNHPLRFRECEISSLAEKGWSGPGAWVLEIEKGKTRRSKVALSNLVLDTPEHRAVLDKAKQVEAQITALREEAAALARSLPRVAADHITASVPKED